MKYKKINTIKEEKDQKYKEGYIKNGRGTITKAKEENIIIYKVDYKVKYKKGAITPQDSGLYETWCTLIRKDKNSPWLIDEIGGWLNIYKFGGVDNE
ncbi:hypothetical protein A0J52_00475 [Clostridium sporogenes]|uniref:DUF4829 domain-containing protein n=1 Tax=Clostridium sporogenes TaxID=1509 RepID=A0A7U4LM56_CLOSG|nr:DUF4829 domain-containing protein [Clostridium sporogenes]STC74402.1 transpeptidase-like protein [Clostridium botulinum]AKC61648.1 hypothetical protein CLSPO_c09280 [Clostridium sporogenes]KCZ68955.1 hypothetical protein CSPO_4c04800 [Clostridium sporogenes]KYN77792.1 hypothetical protein A0J52_00475 [Clostridium sporogenes]MCW6062027.1 DUF4829 domain-containing protein [Clostridium sporogenes]